MKKKKKLIPLMLLTIPISIIGLIGVTENKQNDYENLTKQGNMIAMYIEDEDGEYKVSNSSKFPTEGYSLNLEMSTCKNGGILSQDSTTKLISLSTSSNDTCTLYFEKEKSGIDKVLSNLEIISNGTKTGFDSPATTDEGVFEMEDDYGTSYYYRGAVTNNYVKFGKWNDNTPDVYFGYHSSNPNKVAQIYSTLEECQNSSNSYNYNCTKISRAGKDMYWRIIRINGDGSMRIIYTGTQAYANGTENSEMFIGKRLFNSYSNDNKYVGWMYGPAGTTASTSKTQAQTNTVNSTIKTYIDNWYKENIVDTGYSNAVTDVLFCNDRSTPGKTATGWSYDTGLGYGTNATAFGANARFLLGVNARTNIEPIFKCPQKNDAFTVSDTTKGNGALTYPVGLITADEIVAAGSGKYGTANSSYYLYRPAEYYWSFSPSFMNNSFSNAYVFSVHGSGYLTNGYTLNYAGAVAPVINLSAAYVENMVGDGTIENPYAA